MKMNNQYIDLGMSETTNKVVCKFEDMVNLFKVIFFDPILSPMKDGFMKNMLFILMTFSYVTFAVLGLSLLNPFSAVLAAIGVMLFQIINLAAKTKWDDVFDHIKKHSDHYVLCGTVCIVLALLFSTIIPMIILQLYHFYNTFKLSDSTHDNYMQSSSTDIIAMMVVISMCITL